MTELLNLLAAIALLVWGTFIVRTGVLRMFGENLRHVLARSMGSRPSALAAGMGVTMLLQSSTATCMLMASFVGRQLVPTSAALAVMLGADMGSSLMAVVFSFDLSWLSPLLIFVGVVMFISREKSAVGKFGRVLIGLGLITLALHLIMESTHPLVASPVVRTLLTALPQEVVPQLLVGALLAVMSYSSLAIVLLTATLAEQGLLSATVALGLVLGANLGSGVLGVLTTLRGSVATRRLPVGNLLFKAAGCLVAMPLLPQIHALLQGAAPTVAREVVLFHLGFNMALALLLVGATTLLASWLERWLVEPPAPLAPARPQHLDPMALETPSLAITCAAREALHQADVVETMLRGIEPVLRHDDLELSQQLRKMDDTVDALYSAIKFYLTQISQEALSEREGRRWTDIVSFTINMEQIGDIIERVLQDIEDKKIRKKRRFSDAGMAEIVHLHQRLLQNLRLGMSVFLDGNAHDAQKLLEEKARFRALEHEYAASHIVRLQTNTPYSVETSSLHLDLISDLKRINSHICSIAYPILESAGALANTRLRATVPAAAATAAAAAALPKVQDAQRQG